MANDIIYSTYDAGNVVIFDNAVYIKEGEVNHFPERGKKDSDKEYTSVTFTYDDNNELSGTVHNIWTAEEMAIAHLEEHAKITTSDKDTFVAPYGGIFRCYFGCINGSLSILVNNMSVIDLKYQDPYTSLNNSLSIKLFKDDIVSWPNYSDTWFKELTYFFLPYQYPYE